GKDIARTQLMEAATAGPVAAPGFARVLYGFVQKARVGEYMVVTAAHDGQVPAPSEADLVAYHKAHAAQFSSPEYRAFDYVQIGPDQISGEIQVSDADLKAEYDSHKANYEKAEERQVEQIAFPNKEAADAAAAKIKTAAEFTA